MEIPNRMIQPVIDFFDGDLAKASMWLSEKNPSLGGVSPCDMLTLGRHEQLQKFIDESTGFNNAE